ncbi:tyrosine phosphatase [Oryctes borbonicus]|uniref:protein-tyrosine-phosphatase n=1 Tax=Oryctes borbonicus TaxID=1629725 RepID=A0A0T6BGE1_9SCAR|nr:tyrosine phosphatase [Oryctes borbonicus]
MIIPCFLFYSWIDINNVINHKREFTIESVISSDKADFQFSDVDSAKNAWRFCVLQHMFYRQNEMNCAADHDGKNSPNFQQHSEDRLRQVESYEDVTSSQHWEKPSTAQSMTQRAQSTSALDLNTPTDIDKLRSMLPSYRPAPDYETAVQQKYRNSAGAVQSRDPIRNTHTMLYSSQPEIHQTDTYTTHMYPDVTHNNIEQKSTMFNSGYQAQMENHSNIADMIENMRLLHLYKPPPPYPSNRISSNSTPDLAGISQQAKPQMNFFNNIVSGSSPDLVSTGNFISQQYFKHYGQALYANQPAHPVHRSHSYLPPQHGTYENLSSIFNNNMLGRPQAVIMDNPNITKHIKKVYDEHGNIIYCMPANMKQILQENQLPSTGFVVTRNQNAIVAHSPELNSSNEPIYENIPLPWQNSNGQMRARTQSIHSAPEVTQVVNHTVVNAIQNPKVTNIQHLNASNAPSKESLYANIDRNLSTNSSRSELKQNPKVTNIQHLNASNAPSKESLYANIDRNLSTNSSRSELNTVQNSSNTNLNESATSSGRSNQNMSSKHGGQDSPITISRTNTFIINSKLPVATSSPTSSSFNESRNVSHAELPNEDVTISSSNSSVAKKKRRWGILIGRSKSSEKVKSATLGREKEKNKDKNQSNNRHRWSTGLPRSHPLPPSISKEAMCQLLEYKLADSQLFFEFDKIPKRKQNADFSTALLPENAVFNRFKDVLPYEDNRLRLTPSKDNKYGYVNASHVTATVGSKQRFYVAAQGPTLLTLPYFWQCVWEAEVYLLVQLTDPSEDLTYLPDANDRCIDVGQVCLTLKFIRSM